MGGSVAIMAAPDLPVAAVVADAAYAELQNPIANRMREGGYPLARLGAGWWWRPPAFGPAAAVSRSSGSAQIAPRGLLLIAPREDRLVDWTQASGCSRPPGSRKS